MREIFDFDKLKTFVTGKPVKMRIDSMNGGKFGDLQIENHY